MNEFTVTGVDETTIDRTQSVDITAVDRDTGGEGDTLVAIPAHDTSGTIGETVRTAAVSADTVLVVDDGSSDETGTVASDAGASVVRHPDHRGYGATLRTVFDEAARRDPKHLVVVDPDGGVSPEDIASLAAARSRTQADVVIDGRGEAGPRPGGDVAVGDARAYGPRAYHSLAVDETIRDGTSAHTDVLYHVLQHGYRVLDLGPTVRYDLPASRSEHTLAHAGSALSATVRQGTADRPAATAVLSAVVAVLAGGSPDGDDGGPARSMVLALVGALAGLLGYLALTRPRTVSDDATRYELQVTRRLEASGPDPAVDVTAR